MKRYDTAKAYAWELENGSIDFSANCSPNFMKRYGGEKRIRRVRIVRETDWGEIMKRLRETGG